MGLRAVRGKVGATAGAVVIAAISAGSAFAAEETWSLHGQMTLVEQFHPGFASAFRGPNSLDPAARGNETIDATVFAGVRLGPGTEAYADLEMDQGFGLSNTLGAAGYFSGEAYKVGKSVPYGRLQRLFLRQTFDLGGEEQDVAADANQLAGTRTADNLVLTAGKFSVTDIFDTNVYAHDPKSDFLNWSVIDAGAFDYAADAWGYSYGVATEWTQDWWTLRAGLFDLSRVPNTTALERDFSQFELVGEAEARHNWFGHPGKIKLLGFFNRGRMASYNEAVALAALTHSAPDTATVRRYASRPGGSLNIEQEVTQSLGLFLRASLNDGSKEAYEFTEINRSISTGLSLKGTDWNRPDDTVGFALAVNDLSTAGRRYLAAGGIGILIGDGALVHYDSEDIAEIYYSAQVTSWLTAAGDYQFVAHPAYNADRGPVSVLAARLHAQF